MYVNEKANSWRMTVEHIASAMINRACLPDIPGMNQRDSENLSIALGRFKQLGKTRNNIILLVLSGTK
jgi:hypothetical protein